MSEERKKLTDEVSRLLETDSLQELRQLLSNQRSSDIAEIVELLGFDERNIVVHLLDRPVAAEVLEKVDEATRKSLFEVYEDTELIDIISELDPDDAADILSELPEEESKEFLEGMEPTESAQIKDLMSYTEDSAGGIMDPVLITVPEDATVSEALTEIRGKEIDEDFFAIYVVDKHNRFLGDVRIRSLLLSQPSVKINSLIEEDSIYVKVDADQEEVRNIFSKNDLIVVPVLDDKSKLVGRITADRIIEVAEEEAAEDIYTMAGTDADELDTQSIIRAARVRMTFLLPCLLGTGVTAIVMLLFKNTFMQKELFYVYALAAAFVPMNAAISGNAGLQTSAIVVCGLATGHLAAMRIGQVFMREARVALLVAISCGIVGGLICGVISNTVDFQTAENIQISADSLHYMRIATAFSIAMFSSIMVATSLGLLLPFLFRKIGIDPAISSGPLVTTANDSISATIYLTLTLVLLHL